MDLKVGRKMNLGGRYHLELTADSFNLFNPLQSEVPDRGRRLR